MAENKTKPTGRSVADFIANDVPDNKRSEALILDGLFRATTGFEPKLWAGGIIGYGRYDYTYESGRSGTSFATGFAPRKAKHSIYIMPGYADFSDILLRLGKHKIGKACLYINKLPDVDQAVLQELILAGLQDLATRWDIHPH